MYIGIAGNIGVGKTTLAKIISKQLDYTFLKEPVKENRFLKDFYDDTPRWAFPTQISFVVSRLKKLLSEQGPVVTDRTLLEDSKIFAEKMRLDGFLSGREFKTYTDLFKLLKPLMPKPDLVVYLKASVPTLKSNIANRGRDFERHLVDPNNMYISDLNELYTTVMNNYSKKIITLDFDKLDIVKNREDVNFALEKICGNLHS